MRVLVALTTLSTGCIALSARAHVGVAADDRGAGVEAGLSAGFGYASDRNSGVLISGGVATGSHAPLGVIDMIDYARFGHHLGMRAGIGGTAAAIGDGSTVGVHAATLFPFHINHGGETSEKSFSTATRTLYAGSLELWAGGITRELPTSTPAMPMREMHVGGGASVGIEIISFERWY